MQLSSASYKALLALNNARAPLSNLRVRRALSHAIDRKAIIDGAMAGYAGGFDITLKLPPQSYARRSGEIIASQLARVGVRVRMVSLEWTTWLAEVYGRHDYDMTVVMHVEPMDYDIYGRDNDYYGYSNPAFKALLQRLDAALTPDARIAALQAIQRHIAADAVNVLLFTPQIPSVATVGSGNRVVRGGSWHSGYTTQSVFSAAFRDDTYSAPNSIVGARVARMP